MRGAAPGRGRWAQGVPLADLVDVVDAPAFHVVAPSLPGFGYSDKPATTGWGTEKIAAAWVQLMHRLGYHRFLAHGGDWGGNITTVLAGRFPEHVIGIHSTFAAGPPGLSLDGPTAEERAWAEGTRDFWLHRAAYAKQQATRPQTIGYALVDSPVGLLAWILDEFAEWSITEDSPFERISRDRILGVRGRHDVAAVASQRVRAAAKSSARTVTRSAGSSRRRVSGGAEPFQCGVQDGRPAQPHAFLGRDARVLPAGELRTGGAPAGSCHGLSLLPTRCNTDAAQF